jgi:Zn-dependent protease with chaperone function
MAAAATKPAKSVVTGAQLATAFDGMIEPTRVSLSYRMAVLLMAFAMVLLPVIYMGIVATAVGGVIWYAQHALGIFGHVRGRAAILALVIYIAPLIAGGLLVVFMVLPLFWRSAKDERPMWVDRREQPLLYAYIDQLCDAMRAPRPARIDVIAVANASAHIDNGLFGLVTRRLVLTIGLPLVSAMDLRHFTGVVAHELGHFTQGGSMRLSYVIYRINMWFARLAYGRSGIDDVLDGLLDDEPYWAIALIGFLCKLVLGTARLILKLMALLSHLTSMTQSRQAEFDADRRAARIVGGECLGQTLEMVPFIDASSEIALEQAQSSWARQTLPDDLVVLTDAFLRKLPQQIKDKITASLLMEETSWFDTHPPLFKRIAVLKKSKLQGVLKLDAPATFLFRDFDELCKLATIDLYQTVLGTALQPEHLVPVRANT